MGTVRCTSARDRSSILLASTRSSLRRLHHQALQPLAARYHALAPDLDLEHVVERAHLADPDLRARDQPGLLPARHARPVGVADLADRGARAAPQRRERLEVAAPDPAAAVRNRM